MIPKLWGIWTDALRKDWTIEAPIRGQSSRRARLKSKKKVLLTDRAMSQECYFQLGRTYRKERFVGDLHDVPTGEGDRVAGDSFDQGAKLKQDELRLAFVKLKLS